jgi:hypothetical protein
LCDGAGQAARPCAGACADAAAAHAVCALIEAARASLLRRGSLARAPPAACCRAAAVCCRAAAACRVARTCSAGPGARHLHGAVQPAVPAHVAAHQPPRPGASARRCVRVPCRCRAQAWGSRRRRSGLHAAPAGCLCRLDVPTHTAPPHTHTDTPHTHTHTRARARTHAHIARMRIGGTTHHTTHDARAPTTRRSLTPRTSSTSATRSTTTTFTATSSAACLRTACRCARSGAGALRCAAPVCLRVWLPARTIASLRSAQRHGTPDTPALHTLRCTHAQIRVGKWVDRLQKQFYGTCFAYDNALRTEVCVRVFSQWCACAVCEWRGLREACAPLWRGAVATHMRTNARTHTHAFSHVPAHARHAGRHHGAAAGVCGRAAQECVRRRGREPAVGGPHGALPVPVRCCGVCWFKSCAVQRHQWHAGMVARCVVTRRRAFATRGLVKLLVGLW